MHNQTGNSHMVYGNILYRLAVVSVIACVVGTVVSLAAIAFVEWIAWLNDLLLISPRSRIQVQNSLVLDTATILVPTLGGLTVGYLIYRYSTVRRPLGPADVIKAVQLNITMPSVRDGCVSTLAAVLSLGSGASVGQYGPLVYLGSLSASLLTRLRLRIPNLQQVLLACGVAAAISTAFNAPIAGLVFAHEVILRHYSMQAFAPTTVAAATGYVVANVVFDRPPLFLVEFHGVQHEYEFVIFALLGTACAFLAVFLMQSILWIAAQSKKIPLHPALKPALAGLCVGVAALHLPDVLGIGQEALRFATIEGAYTKQELAVLVLVKLILTAMCIGLGFAGGVFSPSLLIGVLFGALCWSILTLLGIPSSGVAVYAITGMMALTSPVIGAPLTTILIVFELTRNYDLTIAAMVGVVFANLLAYRMIGRSLFDVQLAAQGIDLSDGRDKAQLQHERVVNQPISDYLSFSPDTPTREAVELLVANGRSEAVIIDADNHYLGMFKVQSSIGLPEQPLATLASKEELIFSEHTTLWDAMLSLDNFVGELVPVVSSTDHRLLGVITESGIISAYLAKVHTLRKEEYGSS